MEELRITTRADPNPGLPVFLMLMTGTFLISS